MHYLQVSGHSSSKTRPSERALFFLLEGKRAGGGKGQQRGGGKGRGCIANVKAINEHMETCGIYTGCSLLSYTSFSDSHALPFTPLHWLTRKDKYGGPCENRVAKGEINYRLHIIKHHWCAVARPTGNLRTLNMKFGLFDSSYTVPVQSQPGEKVTPGGTAHLCCVKPEPPPPLHSQCDSTKAISSQLEFQYDFKNGFAGAVFFRFGDYEK